MHITYILGLKVFAGSLSYDGQILLMCFMTGFYGNHLTLSVYLTKIKLIESNYVWVVDILITDVTQSPNRMGFTALPKNSNLLVYK